MELLYKAMQNAKMNSFILHTRFSSQKETKWDEEFITSHLKGKQVEKVWVCGPPLMEESFDKILCSVCPGLGIDFKTQVDIM